MDMSALMAYAITIAVLAIKPGPGVLAAVSRTAARGLPGFASYMGGALTGEILYLAFVVFGFSLISADMVFISILLKAIAGVYLIYLGVNTLKDPITLNPDLDKTVRLKSAWEDYSAGLMLTLSNPFVIVVFAGIVPTVINVHDVHWNHFVILAAVTVVVQLAGDLVYSLPVMISRRFFTHDLLNKLRVASGFVMILIGIYLGYTALPAQDILSVF